MSISRRELLGLAATGLVATQLPPGLADDLPAPKKPRPNRIGVSTYSFWHFRGDPTPIETCLEQASEMGFDGVEILHVHMEEAAKAAGGQASLGSARAMVGSFGDGHLIQLLLKYGPFLYAIAQVILAMFGIPLPPLPPLPVPPAGSTVMATMSADLSEAGATAAEKLLKTLVRGGCAA